MWEWLESCMSTLSSKFGVHLPRPTHGFPCVGAGLAPLEAPERTNHAQLIEPLKLSCDVTAFASRVTVTRGRRAAATHGKDLLRRFYSYAQTASYAVQRMNNQALGWVSLVRMPFARQLIDHLS